MAADPVTPVPGLTSQVAVAGTPVTVVAGGPNGGVITNPYTAVDQGFGPDDPPENLYIDAVSPAGVVGNGTTFCLYPGQSWELIPGQTTATSANSNRSGHKFSALSY